MTKCEKVRQEMQNEKRHLFLFYNKVEELIDIGRSFQEEIPNQKSQAYHKLKKAIKCLEKTEQRIWAAITSHYCHEQFLKQSLSVENQKILFKNCNEKGDIVAEIVNKNG